MDLAPRISKAPRVLSVRTFLERDTSAPVHPGNAARRYGRPLMVPNRTLARRPTLRLRAQPIGISS